jgi:GTPase SAR1 family protein
MALFNYATKEITIKIVYYGPGLSGKTTNLQYLHSSFDPNKRGKLLSLATEADRTLFFDFLPVDLGKIRDFSVRFQLYTVPGQVRYNATRKLVLKGADAVVFVADSQREMKEQNIESLRNMQENLLANNIDPYDIPLIFQYNKRDISNIMQVDELEKDLNQEAKYQFKEAIAIDGVGVQETFQQITRLVIEGISKKHKIDIQTDKETGETKEPKEAPELFPGFQKGDKVSAPPPESKPAPIIDTSIFDEPRAAEIDKTLHEMEQIQQETDKRVLAEEPDSPRSTVIKEVREVPVFPQEKIDTLITVVSDISQTLKELKNVVSSLYTEIRDMKKDQKEMSDSLKDVRRSLSSIKEKKSWFRLS